MSIFNFYSCKRGRVRFNGTLYPANMWTPTESPDELDTSSAESGGVTDAINGMFTLRFQIELVIDGAVNPWDAGFMVPTPSNGPFPTNLYLFLNDTTGPFWFLPYYLIGEVSAPSDVKSFGKGTIKVRNKGGFTRPTGSISSVFSTITQTITGN